MGVIPILSMPSFGKPDHLFTYMADGKAGVNSRRGTGSY
jgi:hypothetical protein